MVVTGTGTGVGKTMVTAAVAALAVAAGRPVAVVKPAQTGVRPGEPGDLHDVRRLAGQVTTRELDRYPDPLAPNTAARRAGRPPVRPAEAAAAARELADTHALVLVEGAGGLLVRFDDVGGSLADIAAITNAPVLVVAEAGLGTLNAVELTADVLRQRGLRCAGVVIGAWPTEPDLASRCNLADLPTVAYAPLLGVLPAEIGSLSGGDFVRFARAGLAPALGGDFDATAFTERHAADPPVPADRAGRTSAAAASVRHSE